VRHTGIKHPVQIGGARSCGQRGMRALLTQAHTRCALHLITFASKHPPLQRIVAGHNSVQGRKDRL
jgi:hypothetical protein